MLELLPWRWEMRAKGRILRAPLSLHSLHTPINSLVKEDLRTFHFKPKKNFRVNITKSLLPVGADCSRVGSVDGLMELWILAGHF